MSAIPAGSRKRPKCILKNSGLADTAYFGAEAEFFIFDNVRFDQNQHSGFYFIDAEEGSWNSGREKRQSRLQSALQGRLLPGAAHGPLSGSAQLKWSQTMIECGLNVECHHHEVATGGQCEIDHALRHAGEDGRQHDDVQVRHQERRRPARQER